MNRPDPFRGDRVLSTSVFKRFQPSTGHVGLVQENMNSMQRDISHGVEVFFISVPTALKA